MSRSGFPLNASVRIAFVALAASVGACSHEQKPAANTAAARVVALPASPAPAPPPPPSEPVADAPKNKEGGDAIYFDFDSATLREDARPVLQTLGETLRASMRSVRIEGNCDEVGTVEYNMALGEHRARAAREYLVHMGVRGDRIATISYGSQHPKYPGHDDEAHAKNRRDDLVVR